ncbi:hemolysin secretion protein D [Rhizobium sp. R72]|uniref:efflux RND transporter periplasmic adaptor subunit n=1 Tax=unclassified Rhizobium TaxID=2613769 RepID=UPI000B532917|nr:MULTISPECIES: efflux RND transporter periplasmic adaptor subunit [unclassified Rhizobium]OWV92788.1 hemolysin secretion protein D [Rhizobium sp. R72]OWV92999.1 hemolysin secretion protein D [Rhizobium sp. R711]
MSMRSASFLLLLGLLLSSCQKQDEARQEPPRPVLSIVTKSTAASSLSLPGTVAAKIETQLGFRVLGRVIARKVSVGDLVKKGDVVAAVDPLSLELAVKSAQSELSNAQAQLANAVSTEERQRSLAETKSGSEAAYEEAELGRRSAIAAVAKAQANLDKAVEQLGYTQLRAEFDGVVTATSAEVGQVVAAGQSVATIARPDQREAVIDIPVASFDGLKVGSPFTIALQLDPTIRASGIIREIAPQAEAATRTQRTKITLIDAPSAFRLGSVITATATAVNQPMILLPSSSVLMKDGKANVWVVDASAAKVSVRAIKIDADTVGADVVRVAEGVKPGERVVVAGVHKLVDGQAVRVD